MLSLLFQVSSGLTFVSVKGAVHTILSKKTQYVLDIVVLVLAFAFAYLIRFDFAPPRDDISSALKQLLRCCFYSLPYSWEPGFIASSGDTWA
jgi:hypothetical protein